MDLPGGSPVYRKDDLSREISRVSLLYHILTVLSYILFFHHEFLCVAFITKSSAGK